MPNTAVEEERRHDSLGRPVFPKYFACNHGLGFAPAPGIPLIGVVLLEIGEVCLRQKDTQGLLEEFHNVMMGMIELVMASLPRYRRGGTFCFARLVKRSALRTSVLSALSISPAPLW